MNTDQTITRAKALVGVLAVPMALLMGVACTPSGGGGEQGGAGTSAPKAAKKDDSTPVLATIGSETITVGEFESHIERQSPFVRKRYENPEQKRKLLQDLIKREAMAQEAARQGYDQHPEVVETMKKVMVQKLIREEFDKNFKNVEVPDAELQAYYDSHESDYHQPEMVRLSHIFFKADPGNKAGARKEAEQVLKDLNARKTDYNAFREAAKKYSDDPQVKTTAGDLNYKSKADLEGKLGKSGGRGGLRVEDRGRPQRHHRGRRGLPPAQAHRPAAADRPASSTR